MRESRRRSFRDGLAVVGALLLHAGLLAVVGLAARPAVVARPAPASPRPDEIAVELGDDPLAPAAPTAPPPNEASGPSEPRAPGRTSVPAEPRRVEKAVVAELAAGEAAAPAPSPPPTAPSAAPEAVAGRPVDLGLGADAWTRWLPPSGQAVAEAPLPRSPREPLVQAPPASTTGGLQEGLEAMDRGRSVGPSGRVVSALEQAAHGEGATAFGVASFAVTVLRTGGVEVRLESASTGDAEWKRVAARAAEDLAKNAPRIPPPREGARFVVDLVADMRLPDGRRQQDLYGPRLEATPPRLRSWGNGKKDLLERNPTAASGVSPAGPDEAANVELPGVYVAQNGKVCSYKFGLSALGPLLQGGCELSNVGTKPQRVVHAHVRNEELF
ncbi:MAG TPA: hypothetical protein VMI54_25045 [Polyangiaceae bacterium]|nr:hypothetical protein [Polyangiaceae bacterium]